MPPSSCPRTRTPVQPLRAISPCPSDATTVPVSSRTSWIHIDHHGQPVSWVGTLVAALSLVSLTPSPLAPDGSSWMVPSPDSSISMSGTVDRHWYSLQLCPLWSDPAGQHPSVRVHLRSQLACLQEHSALTMPWQGVWRVARGRGDSSRLHSES